jgi:hypothetical protein
MAQYIEKIRVPVRLSQPSYVPVDGYLALDPQAQYHSGPETVLERLNAPDRVIPFQRGDDESIVLVSRGDVEWIAADPAVASNLICPPNYQVTAEEHVRLHLVGGGKLEGKIQMELPPDQNRASDFMNGTEDFFPLLTPFGILVVNKERVSSMELSAPSPSPPNEAGATSNDARPS